MDVYTGFFQRVCVEVNARVTRFSLIEGVEFEKGAPPQIKGPGASLGITAFWPFEFIETLAKFTVFYFSPFTLILTLQTPEGRTIIVASA